MKATIKISPIAFEIEIDSSNPEVKRACQKIIDQSGERIEAAIASGICDEIKKILPGVTAECTGIWNLGVVPPNEQDSDV